MKRETAKRPVRSTGYEAGRLDVAADLLERRAAPAERRLIRRRHVVHVVGAEGQRHLRQLGAVARPVHLDVRHVRQGQACQGHGLDVVVAGRGLEGAEDARQRVDDCDASGGAAAPRDVEPQGRARRSPAPALATCRRTCAKPAPPAPPARRPAIDARRRATSASASRPAARSAAQHASRPARGPRRSATTSAQVKRGKRALAGQRPRAADGGRRAPRRASRARPSGAAHPPPRAGVGERDRRRTWRPAGTSPTRRAAAGAARRPACRPPGCRRVGQLQTRPRVRARPPAIRSSAWSNGRSRASWQSCRCSASPRRSAWPGPAPRGRPRR